MAQPATSSAAAGGEAGFSFAAGLREKGGEAPRLANKNTPKNRGPDALYLANDRATQDRPAPETGNLLP